MKKRSRQRAIVNAIIALLMAFCAACGGESPQGDDTSDAGRMGPDGPGDAEDDLPGEDLGGGAVDDDTAAVFEALAPTCQGCHLSGSSFPAFAGLGAFVNLIARDRDFVIPGDPENSELPRLLEGSGTGQWSQMPIGDKSFSDLEAAGQTHITTSEVREWISGLEDDAGALDLQEPVLVRRMTTEQILSSLYDQLGLTPDDFMQVNPNSGEIGSVMRGRYPVHGRDTAPRIHSNAGTHPYERFEALGGPSFLNGTPRGQDLAPLFGHTFMQTAQAWCRVSVQKQGNDALFIAADRSDTAASNPDAIRANIRALFLRMLAVEASDEEVEDLYTSIFIPYEASDSTATAWTAVCACMVRDPLWLSY
jgi:hypothetical protein